MRLPLINLPTVYHVGSMNAADRGNQYTSSFEGAWLSASLCPEAWTKIAKLGGQPTWAISKPDALYIDVQALGIEMDYMTMWAERMGLIKDLQVYVVDYLDEDGWRSIMCATKEEAEAEAQDNDGHIRQDNIWYLTDAGRERAGQGDTLMEANNFAVQFWVEDVLQEMMPQVVGLYWDESFEPERYSAPRAAILPSKLDLMKKEVVQLRYLDDDEDLLEAKPKARFILPKDFQSPYRFITNCVSADGDEINAMMDSPACRDLSYDELVESMGEGGDALLEETFPEYDEDCKKMGLTLGTDRCVSFHESAYQGMPCLFVRHSAIEYIFQRAGLADAPVVKPWPITPQKLRDLARDTA